MNKPELSHISADGCAEVFARLRGRSPRVHCLTSSVAGERTANTLLALGIRPSLSTAPEDVADFVAGSDALLVNLGMMDPLRTASIPTAIKTANRMRRPWVLDPVFADVSDHRRAFATTCLAAGPDILKVNSPESALLGRAPGETICITTGAMDRLTAPGRAVSVHNGDPMATLVTATGCALGAVLAACTAIETDRLLATTTGCVAYGIAIEVAAASSSGRPGAFGVALIDALAGLTPDIIARKGRIT